MTTPIDHPSSTPSAPTSPIPTSGSGGQTVVIRYLMMLLALVAAGLGTWLGLNSTLSTSQSVASEPRAATGPTQPPSTTTTLPVTTTTTTTPTTTSSAEAVVRAYFDAIDARDYQRAWDLGGKNLSGNYAAFVDGFATTASHNLTIVSSQGNTVYMTLLATQTSGEVRSYQGSYTVSNGVIVSANVRQTNAAHHPAAGGQPVIGIFAHDPYS